MNLIINYPVIYYNNSIYEILFFILLLIIKLMIQDIRLYKK